MHGNLQEFLDKVSNFLGGYFLVIAVMNALMALYLWRKKGDTKSALIWVIVAFVLVTISALAFGGTPLGLPEVVKHFIDWGTGAVTYSVGTTVALAILYVYRKFFVKPMVAWSMLIGSLVLLGLAMTDMNFAQIVMKPDNVPIVSMVFLLGYFTWLGTARAVENDDRMERGLPPREKDDAEKVLVWPDLVYTELICMIVLTVILIAWAIALQAPLEEPASRVKTPNPSKAPWYFLGLQEMLVYYDPWMAGVVLPSLVVAGLMAIPYLDYNKQGNGYYTIKQRSFAYLIFQFGFLELWITLIVLGTFLRGPNWNIFGPFEEWNPHKVLALNNIDLSQIFWIKMLNTEMPKAPPGSSNILQFAYILLRESPGIILLLGYFLLLPPIMAMTWLKKYFVKMGIIRFMVMANLLLFMAALPLKMVLRWTANLKYIVSIPEYFLNF
jgi:hypothetical protein